MTEMTPEQIARVAHEVNRAYCQASEQFAHDLIEIARVAHEVNRAYCQALEQIARVAREVN